MRTKDYPRRPRRYLQPQWQRAALLALLLLGGLDELLATSAEMQRLWHGDVGGQG